MALSAISKFDTERLSTRVTQSSHGFVVGDVIRFNTGTALWVDAQADTVANLGQAVVVKVIDTDNFEAGFRGKFTFASAHGFTLNTDYYLSSATAALLTSTAPTIRQKILRPITSTDVLVEIDNQYSFAVPIGGATGDILVKNSATDHDTVWTDSPTVDKLAFDVAAAETAGVGQLVWNADDGTLDLGMVGGNAVQQVGLEIYYRVKNQTGSTIPNGSVVKSVGTTGNSGRVLIALGSADHADEPELLMGLATESIADGADGFVTYFGFVRGLNTTGSAVSETWVDGDILYAHPDTPGALTKVPPTAPDHKIIIALVIHAHTSGTLLVRMDNGYHLEDLHNVYINSIADNQFLSWDNTNGRWKNTTLFSSSISTGQIGYASGTNQLTGSNNLFWDSGNTRLGLNTNSPVFPLHLHQTSAVDSGLKITNSTTGATSGDGLDVFVNSSGQGNVWLRENQDLRFATNNIERLTLNGTNITSTVPIVLPADPTNPLEAVTLQYLQNYLKSWNWKEEVRVTDADANVDISTALENGDILNGVTLVTGDRVLLRNQTVTETNGIYVVPASGAASRADDMNAWAEVPGAVVVVKEGTLYPDSVWLSTSNDGGTLGSTAISFTRIPTGAGLTGSFTSGQVAYATGTNTLSGSSNLRVGSSGVLSVGSSTSPPTIYDRLRLHSTDGSNYFRMTNPTTGEASNNGFIQGLNGDGSSFLYNYGAVAMEFGTNTQRALQLDGSANVLFGATGALRYVRSSNRIGFNQVSPVTPIHIHAGTDTPGIRFTSDTTGATATDGFLVGMDTDGSSYLTSYENKNLTFATSSTVSVKIDGSGNIFVGERTSTDLYVQNNNRIILRDSDNSNHVSLKSPATVSSNLDLTLPGSDGNAFSVVTTNGAGVLSFTPAEVRLSSTTSISATAVGNTTLYTVPTGKSAVITKAIVRCTAEFGLGTKPFCSIGTNSAPYDNIFSSTELNLLGGLFFNFTNAYAISTLALEGEAIVFRVGQASDSTTFTLAVDLFGYLV